MFQSTALGFALTGIIGAAIIIGCGSQDGEEVGESADKVVRKDGGGDAWFVEPTTCAAGWTYDYVTNSCHHAANNGVDAGNAGIFSCRGATSGPYGHTVNWDVPQGAGSACCSPSRNVLARKRVAGRIPAPFSGGTPSFQLPGRACVAEKRSAALGAGPTEVNALDAGTIWNVTYLDCKGTTNTQAACNACCDTNANQIPDSWGAGAIANRENYRTQCKASCAPGGRPTPPGPTGPGSTPPPLPPL